MARTIDIIVIHHSVSSRDIPLAQSIASFDADHKVRLHPEANGFGLHIAYHYVIAGNGDMQATRPEDEVGYHASNLAVNNESLGICLTGNFDNEDPTPEQMTTLRNLVTDIVRRYPAIGSNIFPHRKYAAKDCPGTRFTDQMISNLLIMPDNTPSPWALVAWNKAVARGIVTQNPKGALTSKDLEVMLFRMGLLSDVQGNLSRERFIVALDRYKAL